jgi:hypothetical protein
MSADSNAGSGRAARSRKRVFMSYSRGDEGFVGPFTEILRAVGTGVFRDRDDIPPGKKWQPLVEESLAASDTVLVFWSQNAANSKAVKKEYEDAARLGKDIIPVLMDDTELPPLLKEYQSVKFVMLPSPFFESMAYLVRGVLVRMYEGSYDK